MDGDMRISHRQIEAFRAIMDSGSVTAAADALFLTQPSVSRLLSDLEAALGFKLFARVGRNLTPTPEAHALFDEVHRSFVGLREIGRVADDIRHYRSGSLRIAAMPALGLQLLPALIAKFGRERPGISVFLRVRSSHAVLQHVSSQQFDLGFNALDVEVSSVRRETLATLPMLAVLPKGHPLCAKSVLEPKDFRDQPYVASMNEVSTRSDTDEFFASDDVRVRVVAETQLSFSVCVMVAHGVGISIVDAVTALHYAQMGTIETRPLSPEQPFRYDMLMPAVVPSSLASQAFIEMLREHIEELSMTVRR